MDNLSNLTHELAATAGDVEREVLDLDEVGEARLPIMISCLSDLRMIESTIRESRRRLEQTIAETMTEPVAVGNSVWRTKSKPRLKWSGDVDMRRTALLESARRDGTIVATTDGEAIPEPAYAAGWEAASTLWNLGGRTARKTQLAALGLDAQAEGWCVVDGWDQTVEEVR